MRRTGAAVAVAALLAVPLGGCAQPAADVAATDAADAGAAAAKPAAAGCVPAARAVEVRQAGYAVPSGYRANMKMELAARIAELAGDDGDRYRHPARDIGWGGSDLNLAGPLLFWWHGRVPADAARLILDYRDGTHIRVRILPAQRSWVQMMDARTRLYRPAGRLRLEAENMRIVFMTHHQDGSAIEVGYVPLDDLRPAPCEDRAVAVLRAIARVPVDLTWKRTAPL